jgi:hypothetical protein
MVGGGAVSSLVDFSYCCWSAASETLQQSNKFNVLIGLVCHYTESHLLASEEQKLGKGRNWRVASVNSSHSPIEI